MQPKRSDRQEERNQQGDLQSKEPGRAPTAPGDPKRSVPRSIRSLPDKITGAMAGGIFPRVRVPGVEGSKVPYLQMTRSTAVPVITKGQQVGRVQEDRSIHCERHDVMRYDP